MIPKRLPRPEVKDIMTWLGCWITYCQVVLAFFPSQSVELLKYLDLIVRSLYGFGTIKAFTAKPLYPSIGEPPTWRFSFRSMPAAMCSCHLRLPHRPFGSGHPSPGQRLWLPLRIRGLPCMEQWALYQQLLSVQMTSRMRQVSWLASHSQLPLHCNLPSSFMLLLPPRGGGLSCTLATIKAPSPSVGPPTHFGDQASGAPLPSLAVSHIAQTLNSSERSRGVCRHALYTACLPCTCTQPSFVPLPTLPISCCYFVHSFSCWAM